MLIPVLDDSGSLTWLIDNDDETVDLAIVPISLSQEVLDVRTIQTDLFATKDAIKNEHVNENDEILFAGLFAWNPGSKKNYPIVRHGKLARLSGERIPLDRNHPDKTVEVHLADVMSFGGNSGSPVFLRLGPLREGAGLSTQYRYLLLGVMKGFFPEGMDFAIEVAELRGSAAQNSGIAAIIPADNIIHILQGPRGRAYSDRVVADGLSKKGNYPEAEKLYRSAVDTLQASSPQHSDLATALEEFARFLRQRGRLAEAKASEDKAKRIRGDRHADALRPKT